FVLDASGKRLRQTTWNWYVMDPSGLISGADTNGWKEYWVSRTKQEMRSTGSDGIFADSYDLAVINSCCGSLDPADPRFNATNPIKPPPVGLEWGKHINIFGSYVMRRFHSGPERFYFLPNFGGMITTWDTIRYWRHSDGGMVEGFAHWRNPFAVGDWKLQMNRILGITRLNKILILQSYPYNGKSFDTDDDDRAFLIANYLLIKGPRTYVALIGHGGEVEWYPEYDITVGNYIAPPPGRIDSLYDTAWKVYRRNYANGMALVNPTATPRPIASLGGTYYLHQGRGGGVIAPNGQKKGTLTTVPVTSVVVPAHGGVVLRTTPIPVELSSFRVVAGDGAFILEWTTETESNNAGFEIQRAQPGDAFRTIGWVKGHGTTTSERRYRFVDAAHHGECLKYRLRQVDVDGTATVYGDRLACPGAGMDGFTLGANYPNPARSNSTTTVTLTTAGETRLAAVPVLAVTDISGRTIRKVHPVQMNPQKATYIIPLNGFAPGVYLYRVQAGKNVL
ncbi:MAG: T9SS type A sorting domain-containing protein, partial [Chlorobi bacterium]|nr:T9SS type A sorting domain-containing protein [Chlorobiota bacterium]